MRHVYSSCCEHALPLLQASSNVVLQTLCIHCLAHACNAMLQTLLSAMQCDSVLEATRLGRPVEHSVIDKIRACSSTPNKAVDFFTHLLHPTPRHRLNATAALHHPYLANCLHLMRTGQQPDQALPHVLIDENTPMPLRKTFERLLRHGALREAMPSVPCHNPACIRQGN